MEPIPDVGVLRHARPGQPAHGFGLPQTRPLASRWRGVAALLLLLAAFVGPASPPVRGADDAPAASPALDTALIDEALGILGQHYVDQGALSEENLTQGAIRGLVDSLGDEGHTEYLTAEQYAAEQDALDGRVLGIGVVLDQRAQAPVVISVIDGSPADRAGLRAGDVIAPVDDVETSRLGLGDLADLVRGEPGTTVRLSLQRPGASGRLDVSITRESVPIDPVAWSLAPGSDVAVVRVVQFSEGAGEQARVAIQAALQEGASGLVLDLRGNPGGYVGEAVDVASAFLDHAVAYEEAGRDGEPHDVRIPDGRVLSATVPLVVLVDYATASAAEILAAALRDNGRAVIVGGQTYGTGTVLNTYELSDGSALKVGVRSWRTPKGLPVFRVGITPDQEVAATPGTPELHPDDLEDMTPAAFAASGDLPLLRAVGLLEPGSAS